MWRQRVSFLTIRMVLNHMSPSLCYKLFPFNLNTLYTIESYCPCFQEALSEGPGLNALFLGMAHTLSEQEDHVIVDDLRGKYSIIYKFLLQFNVN